MPMTVFDRDDLVALHHFAREHGRRWKQALWFEWMRACGRLPELTWDKTEQRRIPYQQVLQNLRNRSDFGTRGLEKFRLPKGFWRKR